MAELLKNQLNKKHVNSLANEIKIHHKKFPSKSFAKSVLNSNWSNLELKQRITHICTNLEKHLPQNYPIALDILLKTGANFSGLEALSFPEFVSTYGRKKQHHKISLKALKQLTQYSSSEFAVRPFILENPKKIMTWMTRLSKHKNYHIRRLASEGCRPRLPWAPALPDFKKDPSLIFPILESLKNDPKLYVRKSVANNINDICKDNPELVFKFLKKWNKTSPSEDTQWIIKHGLRSLIKEGHPEALSLLGYKQNTQISMRQIKLFQKDVTVGNKLEFQTKLINNSKSKQRCIIDYIIHHYKKMVNTDLRFLNLNKLNYSQVKL